jgi:hypothetical protein
MRLRCKYILTFYYLYTSNLVISINSIDASEGNNKKSNFTLGIKNRKIELFVFSIEVKHMDASSRYQEECSFTKLVIQ